MKTKQRPLPSLSVGIMCHNEERNIVKVLDSIRKQTCWRSIREILVISSGSSDNTDPLVSDYAKRCTKVRLIREKKRNGKAHAVNIFLNRSSSELLVLISGDLLLKPTTIKELVKPFKSAEIGIAGARPVPVNPKNSFMGYAVHLLWELHHEVSLRHPKMGEAIAFRKVFKRIHELSAVDEVNIESLIRGQGYKAHYSPSAVVYNKGPETIADFLKVRRRIYAGHIATRKEYSYSVSTLDNMLVLRLLLAKMGRDPFRTPYLVGAVFLEATARLLGYADYRFNIKDHTIWDMAPTTKALK